MGFDAGLKISVDRTEMVSIAEIAGFQTPLVLQRHLVIR